MKVRWASYAGVFLLLDACGSSAAPDTQSVFPCEVAEALERRCAGCHGATPAPGVPLSFATWSETQDLTNLTRTGEAAPVFEAMREVLQDDRMPIDPRSGLVSPMPANEPDRLLILSWLEDGAPPATSDKRCRADGGS